MCYKSNDSNIRLSSSRNAGLSYLLGEDWREFFDVVVASAKKPAFFTDSMRPFRELNEEIHTQTWGPVTQLEKGKIYLEVGWFHPLLFAK